MLTAIFPGYLLLLIHLTSDPCNWCIFMGREYPFFFSLLWDWDTSSLTIHRNIAYIPDLNTLVIPLQLHQKTDHLYHPLPTRVSTSIPPCALQLHQRSCSVPELTTPPCHSLCLKYSLFSAWQSYHPWKLIQRVWPHPKSPTPKYKEVFFLGFYSTEAGT